jgi:hypothetical protein
MHSGRGVTESSSSWGRRRADASGVGPAGDNPFALLGLPARPGLSDDDVRAAWRRIAAATHPDREDGGDPAGFGAAAAAYVVLRTGFGRGEALADLGLGEATGRRGRHHRGRSPFVDPGALGAGRHRARRAAKFGWPTPARLPRPGLTRLLGWVARARGLRLGRGPIRRPDGLALPLVAGAAVTVVAIVVAGWSPGVIGVLAGVLSWLLVTAAHAYSRRRSHRPF